LDAFGAFLQVLSFTGNRALSLFLKKKCLQFLVLVVEPDSLGRFLSVTSHNLDPVDFADFGHFAKLDSGDDECPNVVTKL